MHAHIRARRALVVVSALSCSALIAAGCGDSSESTKAKGDSSKRAIPASESFGVSSNDLYSTYCGDGGGAETDSVQSASTPPASSGGSLQAGSGSNIVQQPVVPGMGYNVLTGDYFNPGGVKKTPILDLKKLDGEGLLQESSNNTSNSEATSGNSLSEYQNDYSASMSVSGGAGLFKASASSNFGSTSNFSEKSAFVTFRTNIRTKQYFLGQSDPEELRDNYLSSSFKKSVDNPKTKPATLFTTYGTHLLKEMGLGGRLDMNYRFDSTSYQTKSALEASVKADYGAISASGSYKQSSSSKADKEGTSIRVSSVGGTAIAPTADLGQVHDSYANWVKSVNNNDLASLSFVGPPAEATALEEWTIPIWELASNEQRQRDICVAFYEQLDANAASLAGLQRINYITDIYLASSAYEEDAVSALRAQFPVTATKRNAVETGTLSLTAYNVYYTYPGWAFGNDASKAITDLYIGDDKTYSKNGVEYSVVNGADKKPLRVCGKAIFFTKDPAAAQADGYKLSGLRLYNGGGGVGGDPMTAETEWKLLTPGGINNGGGGCQYLQDWKKVYVQARFTKSRS